MKFKKLKSTLSAFLAVLIAISPCYAAKQENDKKSERVALYASNVITFTAAVVFGVLWAKEYKKNNPGTNATPIGGASTSPAASTPLLQHPVTELDNSLSQYGAKDTGSFTGQISEDIIEAIKDLHLNEGTLPGFNFYHCDPKKIVTRHCYTINDYNLARGYLRARGLSDDQINRIFRFQNRWMQKGNNFITWGWTLKSIFKESCYRSFLQDIDCIFKNRSDSDKSGGLKLDDTIEIPEGEKFAGDGSVVFELGDSRLAGKDKPKPKNYDTDIEPFIFNRSIKSVDQLG